ncbi:MAG TPA: CotY/CotZ family spore coat protein [Candidatus Avamphibacillus sp.]|nr:CotY/CotZ family spore coat protein [Candidatus Avamphibacillus sp.]
MGCKCGKDYATGNCVCDILKEIAEAQSDVVENCCDTSCEQSINDLLGETDVGSGLDTVPVILYCEDGCKPFKGFGAGHMEDGTPGPIEASFIFRVKNVDENCCATLELVRNEEEPCTYDHLKDPADQGTDCLYATGICITVDLSCFCHVTCLPAVSLFN